MNIPHEVIVDTLANVHDHLREGDVVGPLIELEIRHGIDVCLPMPNTREGLLTAGQVVAYIANAKSLVPKGKVMHFIPTVMLTEETTEVEIAKCVAMGIKDGKIYPYMRTTKSHFGVKKFDKMFKVIGWCGEYGMKVHIHAEHSSMLFTNRDAEFLFTPIILMFLDGTKATIIWEHGTDARCIPHWKEMAESGRFFVTITGHHLATNEDQTFGDVRATCKPPIKTEADRVQLVALVGENHPWVMVGPDIAPHDISGKHVHEKQCACGAYTPFQLQLCAHALEHLFATYEGTATFVNFTSRNARKLHELPPASRQIKLIREPWRIPFCYGIGSWSVEPFWAGQSLNWSIAD